MTTSFDWTISSLQSYISNGIVYTVYWKVDAEKSDVKASNRNFLHLPEPEGNVIPYEDLTPDIIFSWFDDYGFLDRQSIESELEATIDEQLASPLTYRTLPWKIDDGTEELLSQ
tara:strand:+ start:497 stop:838 length:342 start_codon:yes stop_codon:yes gene_type:complete